MLLIPRRSPSSKGNFFRDLPCSEPIEKLYCSAGYEPICIYCATVALNEDLKFYPQCLDCTQAKVPRKYHICTVKYCLSLYVCIFHTFPCSGTFANYIIVVTQAGSVVIVVLTCTSVSEFTNVRRILTARPGILEHLLW